jgi:hypothetical protein
LTTPPLGAPINHVAVSMARDALDQVGRDAIRSFYGEVFGWAELMDHDEPGDPLILATGAFGQFLYLLPSDEPMATHRLDHLGVLVDDLGVLHDVVGRARDYAARDPRVQIIDVHARVTHGPTHDYTLTSGYVGYLLPLMIELQHLARHPEPRAAQSPAG